MRVSLATTGLIALMLTGCGRAGDEQSSDPGSPATTTDSTMNTFAMEEAPENTAARDVLDPLHPVGRPADGQAATPPEISPDAAPDVAFGYRYSFALAADRVAPVQQRHARLCEELGAERCKVTGMSYSQKGEGDVKAALRLALEPGLAHRFGERALDGVREAEGKLVSSEVTGTDVGTGIRASTRTIASLEEQLAELEARVAAGGRTGTVRDLQAQAAALREQIRALRGNRGAAREQLATTPVTLSYGSGAYATGKPDYSRALSHAWEQANWLGYGLLVLFTVLLPWAALGGLAWLIIRALRRRRGGGAAAEAAPLA